MRWQPIANAQVDRFGGQNRLDFQVPAQRLFQQMERLGDQVTLFGEPAAGEGPSHVLEQGIGWRGQHTRRDVPESEYRR